MKIDLDDGLIEIKGAKKQGSSYLADSDTNGKSSYVRLSSISPYFSIKSKNDK
jgi:hypothetical protein